jgi:hypothetical protein
VIFTLEALEARQGDALLLHFGTRAKPQVAVIDGGPAGVYRTSLEPRLEQLRAGRAGGGRLPIRLVMVSHIDDDHINGVLQMLKELDELRQDQRPQPYDVLTLWHNSFDDILGNEADVITSGLAAAATAASRGEPMPPDVPLSRPAALILASVKQGRDLRAHASALSIAINEGFRGVVGAPDTAVRRPLTLGAGLSFTVIGPSVARVHALRDKWDREIKRLGVARQAAFLDDSVFNLSSIVVLAKAGRKTMLLTGDARGDDILSGLEAAGKLKNGRCHVTLFKLPHHGSDRNVETEFFRKVTADHYVISANGKHGNPEIATLRMLSEARPDDRFTVYLTNREARLADFFEQEKREGRSYRVVFREPDAPSVRIDLAEKLED